MRLVRELTNPDFKITIFSWNNRYLIKLEQGPLEQTYKIPELDVLAEEDLYALLDAEFLQQANRRFQEMGHSLYDARQRRGL
jgi:hypothetical protein